MSQLKYPVGVWKKLADNQLYALPMKRFNSLIGCEESVYPMINPPDWDYIAAFPRGTQVTNVTEPIEGKRVQCQLGNHTVNTASWAIE